jgi:PAS domain S-box-containing protein
MATGKALRTDEFGFEASLFASIEHSPIAAVITDPRLQDAPIVAANEAFVDLTGYRREEILGRNCRFLAGPKTEPSAQALLREAVRGARPALVELLNYRKDGSAFRNAVMIAPVFNADGELSYFLGSQMDVTGQPALPHSERHQRSRELVRGLTPRQRQVLEHMVVGLRNKQIAALLDIDEKTVKMHRAGLLARLGASTSADAIRIGVEADLSS